VNRRYAEAAAQAVEDETAPFGHDYQLQLVPQMLRELRPTSDRVFLHIPSASGTFYATTLAQEILQGLLGLISPWLSGAFERVELLASRATPIECDRPRRHLALPGPRHHGGAFPISVDCDQLISLAAKIRRS